MIKELLGFILYKVDGFIDEVREEKTRREVEEFFKTKQMVEERKNKKLVKSGVRKNGKHILVYKD